MEQEKKLLHWVRGNILRLAIPLEKETITEEQTTREDYIVQSDDVVTVNLVSSSRRYIYAPKSIEGNVVSIEDNGELDLGTYGVEVLISKADGTRLRSFWNYLIKIHNTNDAVLEEWDEFADVSGEILDSAIFFFAKGDPFTYEDFTQEQLDEIKRPSLEAANVATQAAQNANDAATNANNAKNAAIIATNLANSATQNANDAASSANSAAISANQAKRNADTATINANNATEDALQATSDAITATTDAKRATDKTEEAIEQAQRAAVIGSNPDFIGSDYYVYKYNARLGRYERSNIYVRGDNGDKGEKGDKGDKGDAGTTDYNMLENKPTRVSQFDNDADYATESFVNSSIATATATYRGSYNAVSDLHVSASASRQAIQQALDAAVTNADNNDYCFVQIPTADATPTEIARVERYKHDGSGWLYEYTLNNSGFTAEQWDAINSGITSGDVDKLDALPTNVQLTSLLNGKQDTINDLGTIRSGASAGATAYQLPQSGVPESDLSQGVKDKLNEKEVFWATYGTTTAAEIDAAVAAGKVVVAVSGDSIARYFSKDSSTIKFSLQSSSGRQETWVIRYSNDAWSKLVYAAENKNDKVTSFQSTPDNTHYPSEKLVKDSLDAITGNADDVPTPGSENLVKSGGVKNELALGAVYDVSAKNPTAGPNNDGKFESLSALLSDANLITLIPTAVRKGGMSIKFVQSSDNKYVQYRLMADDFSTNVNDWFDGDTTIQEINDTVNGTIQENTQSITPTFTQGACYADTSHSNFGGVNKGISDCKITGRISLADYLGKSNLKIRLTFPKTNNSNYLKYGAVFYARDSNTYVIQAGATCFASAASKGIETVEIPVPTGANFFRTTFWASDTYGEFSMEFVWDVQQEGLVGRIEILEGSVENLNNEVEELKNVNDIYWAACGDSITNANHNGIDNIPNDDPYKPIDGYSEVSTYDRKNYAYYIAKEKNIKWANYGWGGTTLGMFNSKAYPNVHPFVGERIENMKEGIDWNYISILFGWNDLTFGVVYQKDKWLQETYGEDIGYPVQASQIGAAGFATQEQKDACDAATGSVGGIQYDNNEDYFVARMIGTISDTGKDTYMGAYNYTLDYLMKKYQKSKILICVPFVPNHGSMFYNAVVAIANKWGVPYFDFEDMKYWYRLRVTNTTTLMNPDREDGKWVNYKGYLCPANVAGYNRARFSADDTHPSNLGYKVMSSPFGDKLFNG